MKVEKLGMYRQRDGVIAEVYHIRSPDYFQLGAELLPTDAMSVMVKFLNYTRTHTIDGFYLNPDHPKEIDLVEYLPIEEYPELYV